jgi:RNase adapter protein RapZ
VKKDKLLFWIVTGMSGAGKSQTINCFEDMGFFCVDNLPVALLPKMAKLCAESGRRLQRVALGIDVREGGFLHGFLESVQKLEKQGVDCRIVFLDADDKTLLRRFSETRRRHPLGHSVAAGIREERRHLLKIKELADKIVDTSTLTLAELKQRILDLFDTRSSRSDIQLSLVSFGYKHGLPVDADLVWDVRFMPNPNYVQSLRNKTGRDAAVRKFVLSTSQATRFGKMFFELVSDSLPHYVQEGKSYLTIAIGCTGGHHRSVVMTEALSSYLAKRGYHVRVTHRDIER